MSRAGHQASELSLADVNQARVIAALDIDLGLLLNAVVDDHVELVAFADGRNRPNRAVREQPLDFGFVSQTHIVPDLLTQIRQADVVRGGQNRQHVAAVTAQHDCLGETVAGDMTGLGGARGRHRRVVRDHFVSDVLIEMLLQCVGESHG